jgi:hypothetical protein
MAKKLLVSLPERAKRSSLEFSLQFLRINDPWSWRLSRFWKELVDSRDEVQETLSVMGKQEDIIDVGGGAS